MRGHGPALHRLVVSTASSRVMTCASESVKPDAKQLIKDVVRRGPLHSKEYSALLKVYLALFKVFWVLCKVLRDQRGLVTLRCGTFWTPREQTTSHHLARPRLSRQGSP